jgi:hypothetical protein
LKTLQKADKTLFGFKLQQIHILFFIVVNLLVILAVVFEKTVFRFIS